jgi:hypothetical protein
MADRLFDAIKDEAFSNYLFVFGTVIGVGKSWKSPTQEDPAGISSGKDSSWNDDKKEEDIFFNLCPIFKCGSQHRHFFVTEKYISLVDFLNKQFYPTRARST